MAWRTVGSLATCALVLTGCGRGPFWAFPKDLRCTSVDFVYVIDNSESMQRHQENLRASFGPFIDGMQRTLNDVDDFHVGVVTTDAYARTEAECRSVGALVTRSEGDRGATQECGPFAEGYRYMTEADDLEAAFECTASVGTVGSDSERPMEALENAIDGTKAWHRECNGDFIRDDALLVAVVITDEWDGPDDPSDDNNLDTKESSPGTPQSWHDTVAATKGGNPDNAVVVSLLNEADTGCERQHQQYDGRHIAEFTRMFRYGFVGGICEANYGEIFDEAIDQIDAACDSYEAVVPE